MLVWGTKKGVGRRCLRVSVPAPDVASGLRRLPAKVNPPAPVFHPLAYRGVVAEWPVEWRERWGSPR